MTRWERRKWEDKKTYQRSLLLTYLFLGYSRKRILELMDFPSMVFLAVELNRAVNILRKDREDPLIDHVVRIFENDILVNRGY